MDGADAPVLVVTGRVSRSIATPRTDGAVAALLDSAVPDEGATRAVVVSAGGRTRVTVPLDDLAGARIEGGRLVGPAGPDADRALRPGGGEWVPAPAVGEHATTVLVDDVARIEVG
ncbi:MAG: hypothetical protein U0U69_04925 [Acidimicrobiia bacterium]